MNSNIFLSRNIVNFFLQLDYLSNQRWPEDKLSPSVTRIKTLLNVLGSPQKNYLSIHIAGTNGKTSVVRIIDTVLTSLNYSTGRIISPHLQSTLERISINGKLINLEQYIQIYSSIEPFIELIDHKFEKSNRLKMSKFEILTAMAFIAFSDLLVDIAIVEVGMGGRWDATNVVNASVNIITPIDFDHMEYLGSTISKIALEKAGVIKKRRKDDVLNKTIVVISNQIPMVMQVLIKIVVNSNALVARENCEFSVLNRHTVSGGQIVNLQGLSCLYNETFIPLYGKHQAQNTALAIASVEAFLNTRPYYKLNTRPIKDGLAYSCSPGRIECLCTTPPIFIDSAHNPGGATTLAYSLQKEFDFNYLIGIVSMMANKNAIGILAKLETVFNKIIITNNGSSRAMTTKSLSILAEKVFGKNRTIITSNLVNALDIGVKLLNNFRVSKNVSPNVGIVVTGSVVTSGAIRNVFGKYPM